jgi:hypothetical protein
MTVGPTPAIYGYNPRIARAGVTEVRVGVNVTNVSDSHHSAAKLLISPRSTDHASLNLGINLFEAALDNDCDFTSASITQWGCANRVMLSVN